MSTTANGTLFITWQPTSAYIKGLRMIYEAFINELLTINKAIGCYYGTGVHVFTLCISVLWILTRREQENYTEIYKMTKWFID